MKMKRIVTILCAMLLLCMLFTGLYFWYRHIMLSRVIGYQPMRVMVDGNLYMNYGDQQPEKPAGDPDGMITEIIGTASFPKKDGQANFGSVGIPYWHVGDKIVVAYGQYYLFEQS